MGKRLRPSVLKARDAGFLISSVLTVALLMSKGCLVFAQVRGPESLSNGAIVLGEEPRYVQRGIEDLQIEVYSTWGHDLATYGDLKSALSSDHNPIVVVGKAMVNQFAATGTNLDANNLRDDGFLIRDIHLPASKARVLVITGRDPHGTMYGVLELVRRLTLASPRGSLPYPLEVQENPSFALRGIYAHTAWVYNYPFALRRWKFDDWKRYVDLLAALRVNLLQIWTPVSIMPVPLSEEDRRYLTMFDQVTRYAKEERGFREVWLGDAANNVALPTNKPIDDREYYVVHSLRNPADAKEFKDIISSRTALYRAVPHADGYWVIDSDPGNWPGSPSHEFARILELDRKLINEYTALGGAADLLYWIWQGWGTGSKARNLEDVLTEIHRQIKGRYGLLVCFPNDLPIVQKFGLLGRSTWFPYGAVEGEPSSPYTALRAKQIEASFEAIKSYPQGLRGVMANAQTPLVQIPNIWLFERKAWDTSYRPVDESSLLLDVAKDLYPKLSTEIADGWHMLSVEDVAGARAAALKLDDALRGGAVDPPGFLGRFVTPDGTWVVKNLVSQLKVHTNAIDLATSLRASKESTDVLAAATRYLDSATAMENTTGFRPALNKQGENLLPFFNWFYDNEDYARVRSAFTNYRLKNSTSVLKVYNELRARCGDSHSQDCDVMVQFLLGDPPRRSPDFHYAN